MSAGDQDAPKRFVRAGIAVGTAGLVSLTLAAAVTPASFQKGTYGGTTSQGRLASFTATKSKVHLTFFDMQDSCDDDTTGNSSYAGLDGKIKDSGKFTIKGPGDSGFVKGKFKGTKVKGTAFHQFTRPGGVYCSTPDDLSYTLNRESG